MLHMIGGTAAAFIIFFLPGLLLVNAAIVKLDAPPGFTVSGDLDAEAPLLVLSGPSASASPPRQSTLTPCVAFQTMLLPQTLLLRAQQSLDGRVIIDILLSSREFSMCRRTPTSAASSASTLYALSRNRNPNLHVVHRRTRTSAASSARG